MAKVTARQIRGPNREQVHVVRSWEEAQGSHAIIVGREPRHWVYRGASWANYPLKSSLERCFGRWVSHGSRQDIEDGLLRRFQRNAYRYLASPPKDTDRLEWLALMQHHGAPTRLLDWTFSFYVASFFALTGVSREPGARPKPCAVWAIPNWELCEAAMAEMPDNVRLRVKKDAAVDEPDTAEAILSCNEKLVYQVTPRRLNERVSVQQGTFLVQTNLSVSFVENLAALSTKLKPGIHRIVLDFSQSAIQEALTSLGRMNVNRTSLFPGLDGFASDMGIFGFDRGYRTTGGSWKHRLRQK